MEGLLQVDIPHQLTLVAIGVNGLVGRQHHAGRIGAGDTGIVAQGAEGRGDDALGYTLVGDAGNVVDAHALVALGNKQVLAAMLDAGRRPAAVRVAVQQLPVIVPMLGEPVRIGVAMQVGTDHCLRFIPLGHLHPGDVFLTTHPGVVTHQVDETGAVHQQLRHDRVVVVVLRQVAVLAVLGLGLAHSVGEMRVEGLRTVATGRDRRLLDVDLLAVGVGRGQYQRRRRAHRCDLAALGRLAASDQEHLVAGNLRVVGGPVARVAALVVLALGLVVGLDRQVAAGTAGGPRGMAGVTLHVVVAVRQVVAGDIQAVILCRRVPAHELGPGGLFVVARVGGIHRVLDQAHLPLQVGVEYRALDQGVAVPFEAQATVRVADGAEVGAAVQGRGAGGEQVGVGGGRAVAVLAVDLHRGGDLAVNMAVAVGVLGKVAVDAVHALVQVNGGHVHGFLELVGIIVLDHGALGVQQVAGAVALEYGAEVPAVAVVVGELGIGQGRVEF